MNISEFGINSEVSGDFQKLTPKVKDCKGYKYFKMNDPNKPQFRKLSPDELDELFNPEKDKRRMQNQDLEFDEETKISILEDINQQYVVDRVQEQRFKRGIIADVSDKPVPHVPKVVQNLCRRHIRAESMKSPVKYEFTNEGKVVQISERKDKEILKTLPKLKFFK
jgi:hypothetical protein